MAAYAALVSVMNIIDQIQNHRRHSFSFDNNQMEFLSENVDFLVEFLEFCPDGGSEEVEALERQIASAAYAAEDVLESHVADQIHSGSTLNGETSSCFLVGLQKVNEELDSIKKLAMEVKALRAFRDQQTRYSGHVTSSRPLGKNVMVRYDGELIQLMERLTRQQPDQQIIQIVGMGGIGKTTLARNVYEHLHIVQHFDVRLWATVSQEYSAEKILLQLLSCLEKSTSGTVHGLGDKLHKTLTGRRYLVVLDDMWSVKAWEEIQLFLPQNSNGSSIVITTRQSTMAIHLGSNSFEMKFLDENASWKLLCEKAFGEEGYPLELEEIGKNIAKNCKGLPLSVVVIGGHLRKSSRMKEHWELVGNDVKSILSSEDDEQCLKILYLSYSYLPTHLKPCFLYMGIYSEDEVILVSDLIKLWVAEGFVKPNKVQSLEEIAEDYLKDLVDRNLIIICQQSRTQEIHSCRIHDLLRELCLRVAEKEKFLCVLNNDTPRTIYTERRVVVFDYSLREENHPDTFHTMKLEWGKLSFRLKLLRVLNGAGYGDAFGYFQQENLRFIVSNYNNNSCTLLIPSLISRLWNLQTLKITGAGMEVMVPSEIWEMPQLRNVELPPFYLPHPPRCSDQQDELVLENLQTLSIVKNFSMSEEVCKRIPNISKLIVYYDYEAASLSFSYNFGQFGKLVSLYLGCYCGAPDLAASFTLPASLRELSLLRCNLKWKDLRIVGSLPCLELLQLQIKSVSGHEWKPAEGGFPRLKYLEIWGCRLHRWNADSSHFPVLERLCLYSLSLGRIPSGIGEIPTLDVIELHLCRVSAAISAMEILVEQESLGNEDLQLKVEFYNKSRQKRFEKQLKRRGLRSKNLFLTEFASP